MTPDENLEDETITAEWAAAGRKAVAGELYSPVSEVHTVGYRVCEQLRRNQNPEPDDVQALRQEITELYRVTEEMLAPMAHVDPYTGNLPIGVTPVGELREYMGWGDE
jgi:hypothetical protein